MDTTLFVASRSVTSENQFSYPVIRNSLASVVSALESLPAWTGVLGTNLSDARVVLRKPMLILEGRQGIGKSRALATLAGPRFFSDAAIDFGTKDACQTIQGVWICELAELDAILRRDPAVVKAFLSRAIDRFRDPYGRTPENVPRGVVFAGTVNHGAYLRDTTGNRRYWIVRCEQPLDIEGLAAARDQLWAEALHLYRSGETWHLDSTNERSMADVTDARVEADPWEALLAAWTAERGTFSMDDVLGDALGLRTSSLSSHVTTRVSRLLSRLGFERRRRTRLPRVYEYVRVDVQPSPRPGGPAQTSELACDTLTPGSYR